MHSETFSDASKALRFQRGKVEILFQTGYRLLQLAAVQVKKESQSAQ